MTVTTFVDAATCPERSSTTFQDGSLYDASGNMGTTLRTQLLEREPDITNAALDSRPLPRKLRSRARCIPRKQQVLRFPCLSTDDWGIPQKMNVRLTRLEPLTPVKY